MNELHLFAGAGGGILAGVLLGHRCIGAVECSPFAQSVLRARQRDGSLPTFPIFSDIKRFDARPYRGRVDIVAGGFPCQVNSSASRGRRVAEDLWAEFLRVVADAAPWLVFAENVTRGAIDAAAADLGADHVRRRYWVLAHADMHGELLRTFNAEVAGRPRVHPSLWQSYPGEPRVADGMGARVERLAATGNGQIPIVAAAAFTALAAEFSEASPKGVLAPTWKPRPPTT